MAMKGFFLLFLPLLAPSLVTAATNTLRPSCKSKCGDIDIPYPFGIGDGCYAKEHGDFSINCTDDSTTYLGRGNVSIVGISTSRTLQVNAYTGFDCYDTLGNRDSSFLWFTFKGGFTISHTRNKFVVIGCDTYAFINVKAGVKYSSGCMSYCENKDDIIGLPNGGCSRLGCCEVSIPRGIKGFSTEIYSFLNYTRSMNFNRCGYAFLAEESRYNLSDSDLSTERLKNRTPPLVIDWSISSITCAEANKSQNYACRSKNSHCVDSNNGVG